MFCRFFFILVTLFIFNFSIGQDSSSEIIFSHSKHDFGYTYEADGPVTVSFSFKNIGHSYLTINRIIAPGFKVISWTRDSIAPNKSGEIKIKMNPFNQAGYFNKSIRVFSNAHNSPSELKVKGKILHGTYSKSFKHKIGGLAFKQSQLNFGYIYNGQQAVRFIPVMNKSQHTVRVAFEEVPPHLIINTKFDSLASGQNSFIEIKYNTNDIDDWDFVINRIKLLVRDQKKTEMGLLSVTANIREDFSGLSNEEKTYKPRVSIPVKIFNFDTISDKQTTFYDFLIRNNGERPLDIRAVKPTCGCTAVMPVKNSIAPGDSTYIKVSFEPNGYIGHNKKGVTVITNDPDNYKQFIWVTGFVEKH